MLRLHEQLVKISPMLKTSPEPTIEDVEQAGVFCVCVEGTWLRVRTDGPIFSTSANQFEVLCIDFGYKQLVEFYFIFNFISCNNLFNFLPGALPQFHEIVSHWN